MTFFPVKDEIDYNQVKIDDDFPQKSKSGLRASDIIFRKIPKLALEPPTAVMVQNFPISLSSSEENSNIQVSIICYNPCR